MKKINNWVPEVQSLIRELLKAGIVIVGGCNGEESFNWPTRGKKLSDYEAGVRKFIEELIACDQFSLTVRTPDAPEKLRVIDCVLGNSPGELVSDYTYCEPIEKVARAHYEKWEGRTQPKKTCPFYLKRWAALARVANMVNTGVDPTYYKEGNSVARDISDFELKVVEGQSCGQEVPILRCMCGDKIVIADVHIPWLISRDDSQKFPGFHYN